MSQITKTMIGDSCVIGSNVFIQGSYIMNNVVVKDNCKVINSFIAEGCTVEENSNLQGIISSENICIKNGSQLKGNILEGSHTDTGMIDKYTYFISQYLHA